MNDDKPIDKLAADLADGKAIDWEQSKRADNKHNDLLAQLNSIAKISAAYEHQLVTDAGPQTTNQSLFTWGHLQVLEAIGEGSYGEVYRAHDSVLDREVALKLLKKDRLAPIQSRAFIQEARRLAKVRNRHVLAVHGANVHEGRVGIWSDLIIGTNLAEQQKGRVSAPWDGQQLMTLLAALADALLAVHEAGLIHGDIKASNVMVDQQGRYTLMDFGAGTEFDPEQDQSGYLIGTLLYMAPELFGKNRLSTASDIYALGVLLFYLVSGEFPVTGKDMATIKQAHEQHVSRPLVRLKPNINKSLQQLIQQMLDPVPAARPTAGHIKQQLEWIRSAPQRRNKRLIVAAIVGLSVMGTLVSGVGFYRANQAQQVAVQEKEKAEAFSDFMRDTLKAPASLGKGKEVRVADLLQTAATEAAAKFADQPHTKAAIFHAIGDSYNSLKLPEDALLQLSESLSTLQQLHGPNSPATLSSLLAVAESYHVVGDDAQAKALYQQAATIAAHNQQAVEQVFAQIKLADLTRIAGQYQESVAMLEQLLPAIPAQDSQHRMNRFLALTVLAQNHLRLADHPLAEQTAKQALQWLQTHYPEDDIRRNEVLNIIARTLIWQRKLPEAEAISEELVVLVQRLYGQNNYEYLRANTLLSTTLFEQGKLAAALAIQQRLLALTDQVQGDGRLYTIIISNNLLNTLVKLGDFQQAEQVLQDALRLAYDFLPADNVQILTLELNQLALVNAMGDFTEAEKLAEKLRSKVLTKLGEQHLFYHLIQDELAVSYAGQQRFDEALELHQSLVDGLTANGQAETSQMITILQHHANSLVLAGQLESARDKLRQLIQLQIRLLGDSHPDTIAAKQTLAGL